MNAERRPSEAAAQEAPAKSPDPIVAPGSDDRTHDTARRSPMSRPMTVPPADWDGLDLDRLTDVQRRVFWAAYGLGYMHGLDRGREQADAEAAADWVLVAAHVRKLGSPSSVPYSELARRRGQHERAERARANEKRVMFG